MARAPKRKRSAPIDDDDVLSGDHNNKESEEPKTVSLTEPCDSPFTVTFPALARGGKRKKRARASPDADAPPFVEESPFSDGTEVVYNVRPQSLWQGLRRYRNFVVSDETFALHQYVFVNHSGIEHGADLSEADAKMFWVARVLEIRAVDPEHVYLRVFWSYWPDELPGGAQPYHGKNELIASNHMEIIDAMTVAGKANVQHWLENDEDDNPPDLFWRQTYDFFTKKTSTLRKHCACGGYYNPDSMLICCSYADCKRWLHKECILKDALAKTYSRLKAEEGFEDATPKRKPPKGRRSILGASAAKAKAKPDPWENMLTARLTHHTSNTKGKSTTQAKVVITDVRDDNSSPSSVKDANGSTTPKQPRIWEEDIVCLGCKRKIV